jgi:hypothetical protein
VSQSDALAARYGAPSPGRRRLLVVVSVAVAAVFLGWLGWAAIFHSDPEVRSEMLTYTIDGEHGATARVDVRLGDDAVEATCLLRAVAEDHTVVGELSFTVTGADVASGTVLERQVRTERRATSVELMGCTAPGQPRPQ